jgi:serine/threonine-protein kinase mTOR
MQRYVKSKKISDISQAWDLYYNVFKNTKLAVSSLASLELEYASPKLLNARDLELAIPGTFQIFVPHSHFSILFKVHTEQANL